MNRNGIIFLVFMMLGGCGGDPEAFLLEKSIHGKADSLIPASCESASTFRSVSMGQCIATSSTTIKCELNKEYYGVMDAWMTVYPSKYTELREGNWGIWDDYWQDWDQERKDNPHVKKIDISGHSLPVEVFFTIDVESPTGEMIRQEELLTLNYLNEIVMLSPLKVPQVPSGSNVWSVQVFVPNSMKQMDICPRFSNPLRLTAQVPPCIELRYSYHVAGSGERSGTMKPLTYSSGFHRSVEDFVVGEDFHGALTITAVDDSGELLGSTEINSPGCYLLDPGTWKLDSMPTSGTLKN